MMIKSLLKLAILLIPLGVIFFLSWGWVNQNQNIIQVLSFYISILALAIPLLYHQNIAFNKFIQRLFLHLIYRQTAWTLTSKYDILVGVEDKPLDKIRSYFQGIDCPVKKEGHNILEVLWKNRHLVSFQVTDSEHQDYPSLYLKTTQIDVSSQRAKKTAAELSEMLESIESVITFAPGVEKIYEIEVEYEGKNPYFLFWNKKKPEDITDFSFQIKVPGNKREHVWVKENKIRIQSGTFSKLLNNTIGMVMLQEAKI